MSRNYQVSKALNSAMRSGSMVVMTPEQVHELMGSRGRGNYRGGRGRGYVPRGRGRGQFSPRDGRRDRNDHYDSGRSHYNGGASRHHQDYQHSRYDARQERRYEPYRGRERTERDSRHQRAYSGDHRAGEHRAEHRSQDTRREHLHHRTHSREERHDRTMGDGRQRSPRHSGELEKKKEHRHEEREHREHRELPRELPRDSQRDTSRGRGRGRGRGMLRTRFPRGRMGMVNRMDRFRNDNMGIKFMMPSRGRFMMRRGMRGRGMMQKRTFNAYYYCRMCERRYYGNREFHKTSREHKEAVRKNVEAIESGRKEGEKDILEDFQVMDEVGESDEEKEKRDEDIIKIKSEENLEDGEIKDKKAGLGKSDSRTTLNQEITPDISKDPLGLRYIIGVSGFFCKLCSKFYHDEKTAKTSHVKTPQHLERVLKAAKEQYTRNYIEKKRSETKSSETQKSGEVKVKTEPMETTPEKSDEKKARSDSDTPEKKESTLEADARKAGKAAASAKIAAVTAKFSAPRRTPRRPASSLTRKSIASLRAKRLPKKAESDVASDVNDVMDDVSIEAPEPEVKAVPEEGEITDGEDRVEIDDSSLDSAAPQEIPGLDD